MITYIRISLITMIVSLIVEYNNLEEQEAIYSFYNSNIADALSDKSTGLYLLSPYLIYELWNEEYKTGDYKESPYYFCMI